MSDEAANRAEAERLAQFAYDRTTMSPACRRDLATLMCESLREAEQRGAINHMVDCVSERNAAYQRGLAEGARAEREACAKLAETPSGNYQVGLKAIPYWDGEKLAAAIRARSEGDQS